MSNKKPKLGGDPAVRRLTADVRRLTAEELAELRRDMAEASAWARTELKRRRLAVQSQTSISRNGISDGIND
ncbi:hypothetical protein [Modicisalibacter tunisiensis]|uniref:Uncharacterized protein n=1 Tax=Modicisalibacter tunisiensis TaxID=390637 RepID=A0ABS7WX59_9GAMM|nr:hypothetical protein [Modicisalibacter tunisiensis]MBZ9566362.1 hypothetical protein [Modicisalibacter tunisiensis]